MIRVVFVDDDLQVLDALKDSMRHRRSGWNMAFYSTAAAALVALSGEPADVVVSDMRMPEMDGEQLLAEIARLHPHTVRFIFSATSGPGSHGAAHRYFSKARDMAALQQAIATIQSRRTP